MGKYYCYRHVRFDKNEVFYVGVGMKHTVKRNFNGLKTEYKRAYSPSGRNNFWNKIVKKTKFTVEIIYECDSEVEIDSKEKEFIKLYGRRDLNLGTLTNLTDGGDGRMNPERSTVRNNGKNWLGLRGKNNKRCKPVHRYNLHGDYVDSFDSVHLASELSGFNRSGIVQSCNNKISFFKGFIWRWFKNSRIEPVYPVNYCHIVPVYEYSITGKFITKWNTIKECAEHYNVKPGNISRLCDYYTGLYKAFRGKQFRYEYFVLGISEVVYNIKTVPINQYDLNGNFIHAYISIKEALQQNENFTRRPISDCIRGVAKTAFGYKWTYLN